MAQQLLESIAVSAAGKSDTVAFVPYETLERGATANTAAIDPKRQVKLRFRELSKALAFKPTAVKHRDSLVPWEGLWEDAEGRDPGTGMIPRRKTSVAWVWPWIWLDIDDSFKDKADFDRLLGLLRSLDLTFWWYTTWSNGLPGKPGFRVRLVLLTDRKQQPEEASDVRRGLSLLFASALGKPGHLCDKNCFEFSRQFIRPVFDPTRPQHKFMGSHNGSKCVSVDAVLPHGVTGPKYDSQRVQVETRPAGDWPVEIVQAARAELDHLCYLIRNNRLDSLRSVYFAQYAQIGNLMKSGCLSELEVYESYKSAVLERSKFVKDEHTPIARTNDLFEISRYIRDTKPGSLPAGFDEAGQIPWEENPLALYQLARADDLLRSQVQEKTFTKTEAMQLLELELRAPIVPGMVKVIKVNGGAGKSHHLDKVIVERVREGIKYIVLSRTHRILGEHRERLTAWGVKVTTLAGLTARQADTGLAECLRVDDPEIIQVRKRNANMYVSACSSCPLAKQCPAIARESSDDVEVILAPYQLVDRALEVLEGFTVVIVCDEEPPAPQQVRVEIHSLKRLALDGTLPIWKALTETQGELVRKYAYCLAYHQPRKGELLEALSRYRGQKYGVPCKMTPSMEADDAVIGALLTMSLNDREVWYQEHTETWFGTGDSAVWRALNNYGGVVLSATPNPLRYKQNARISHFPIQDSDTTMRTWFISSQANRRKLLSEGINQQLVEHLIRQGLKALPEDEPLLIVTYSRLIDYLKSRPELTAPRKVDYIHAHMAIGLNQWAGWNVLVLGDEIAPPRETPQGPEWTDSLLSSAFHATQSAARARTAQDHSPQPAIVFIGRFPPTDFHSDNCLRISLGSGRPEADEISPELHDALQELLASLGPGKASKLVDVPDRTLRRWVTTGKIPWRQQQLLLSKLAGPKHEEHHGSDD